MMVRRNIIRTLYKEYIFYCTCCDGLNDDIEEQIKDIMKKTAIDYAIIIQQIDQQWKMNIIGSEIKYFFDIIKIVLKKKLTSSLDITLTTTDVKYIHNYMKYKYVYIINFKSLQITYRNKNHRIIKLWVNKEGKLVISFGIHTLKDC